MSNFWGAYHSWGKELKQNIFYSIFTFSQTKRPTHPTITAWMSRSLHFYIDFNIVYKSDILLLSTLHYSYMPFSYTLIIPYLPNRGININTVVSATFLRSYCNNLAFRAFVLYLTFIISITVIEMPTI